MAQKNAEVTGIAASFPATPNVAIYPPPTSVGVTNRDATNYVEVSFDGTNPAKKLLAGESLIWDRTGPNVYLRGPSSPSAEVFWE